MFKLYYEKEGEKNGIILSFELLSVAFERFTLLGIAHEVASLFFFYRTLTTGILFEP